MESTIKKLVRNELHRRGYLVHRASELTRLANKFGSDKGTRLSAHMYTRVYENFFEPLRHKRLCVLEMGLLRSDIDKRRSVCGESTARASDAPSLKMWRAYFPNAKIFGFDIDDFSEVSIPGCRIMKGDMSSRADIERLMTSIGEPIDIIIDDASHASHHQQIAFGILFRYVRPGGMYIIEDLHWQNDSIERAGAPKTRDLLRRLQIQKTFASPYISDAEKEYLCQSTSRVWLFDSLSHEHEVRDNSDAIAVIEKLG
jgi:hypothetical protein